MHLPDEFKLYQFSDDEYGKYGIFDADGCIIGVKDDAPPEFKEAYEHDMKKRAEPETSGID